MTVETPAPPPSQMPFQSPQVHAQTHPSASSVHRNQEPALGEARNGFWDAFPISQSPQGTQDKALPEYNRDDTTLDDVRRASLLDMGRARFVGILKQKQVTEEEYFKLEEECFYEYYNYDRIEYCRKIVPAWY